MKKILIPLLILALVATMSMGAFAAESPTAPVVYNVTVSASNADQGTVEKVENEDGTVTFTVTVAEGATFESWKLTGDYEIVKGSLTETSITIKALSDVTVEATYADTTDATEGDSNNSATSPETGNAPFAATAAVLFTALGAAYVAKKNLSK